jgi:hypothetical protein
VVGADENDDEGGGAAAPRREEKVDVVDGEFFEHDEVDVDRTTPTLFAPQKAPLRHRGAVVVRMSSIWRSSLDLSD